MKFTDLLVKISSLPSTIWETQNFYKILVLAILAYLMCSCGTTRAVIRTTAEGTASTISITTNNPTSVNVSPRLDTLGVNINHR